jgi:hypothetical protein
VKIKVFTRGDAIVASNPYLKDRNRSGKDDAVVSGPRFRSSLTLFASADTWW